MQEKGLQDYVEEAINLSKVMVIKDAEFCVKVAKKFLGKSVADFSWDFCQLMFILYGYGMVVGKRKERSKRRVRNEVKIHTGNNQNDAADQK